MNHNQCKSYLLNKPGAQEDFPFGPEVGVYKVATKMFATLAESDGVHRMNLKCDPTEALMLRDIFDSVLPGYHMNKKHWNTVLIDGSIPDREIQRMIDHSYTLVVEGLPVKSREILDSKYGKEKMEE